MPRLRLDEGCVLLTGASSGIGLEIARLCARRWAGMKQLALVARRTDRLEKLRDELLAARPDLKVHLLPCDLADPVAAARVADDALAAMGRVDVLVNNAGVGDYALFDRADPETVARMITLNVSSLVALTHKLAPAMVARGSGGVLNISSGFGLGVLPGFAGYSASKHFVTAFTETLRIDFSGTGVVVTQVCPGPVRTEFGERSRTTTLVPSFAYITADKCARAAVRGFERGRAMIVPGWVMRLLYVVNTFTPRIVARAVLSLWARRARRALPPSADRA
jgi:hypothetical protein